MFSLEKTSKKYPCPSCGRSKCFKRYADETGRQLPDEMQDNKVLVTAFTMQAIEAALQ